MKTIYKILVIVLSTIIFAPSSAFAMECEAQFMGDVKTVVSDDVLVTTVGEEKIGGGVLFPSWVAFGDVLRCGLSKNKGFYLLNGTRDRLAPPKSFLEYHFLHFQLALRGLLPKAHGHSFSPFKVLQGQNLKWTDLIGLQEWIGA